MEEIKRNYWINALFWGVMIIGIPVSVRADLTDIILQFHPYVSVQETYTNNVNLTPKDKKDEYITTVTAGLRYTSNLTRSGLTGEFIPVEGKTAGADLNFNVGGVYYAKGTTSNYISLSGMLNAFYALAPRLTFKATEYIMRSDESLEQSYPGASAPVYVPGTFIDLTNLYLAGTQRQRSIWLRNVFSPSIDYKLSEEGTVGLTYRNNIYTNQSSIAENSQENFISPRVTYWFDIRNGILLQYGYDNGHFERSPDLTAHMALGKYTYRFNPRTSIFGQYTFSRYTFDQSNTTGSLNTLAFTDHDVHSPTLGISHQFSPSLSGTAQFGYFWELPERGKEYSGPVVNVALTQTEGRTTYTLLIQGGYQENYFTAENLGFTNIYQAVGIVTYRPMEKLTTSLSGTLAWDKSRVQGTTALATSDQKDTIWVVGGNVSYALFRWLNLSLNLSYKQDRANVSARDYEEFRAMLGVQATL